MTPEQLESVKALCAAAPSTFTLVGDGKATGMLTEDGYSVAFHSKPTNWYGYMHPLQFLEFVMTHDFNAPVQEPPATTRE